MATTLWKKALTNFLCFRKLKNQVESSSMNRKTFPNDEENCIENSDISLETVGESNLVTCKGEPSSFWMDNETNNKESRRESEDSLLKFAIQFSKESDDNSSYSGESDTRSNRPHIHGNNVHGHDLPSGENADTGTDGENMVNEQGTDHVDPNQRNDAVNGIRQKSPDTNELSENGHGDESSQGDGHVSEESRSSPSSPRISNGINSPHGGLRQRRTNGNNGGDDISIEVEVNDEKEHFQTPEGHLESYLYILQFLGISAFRRVEYRRLNEVVAILLKVLFWIVSACALLNSIKILKRVGIENAPFDKDLQYCVKVGFAMILCFSRFYFIKLAGTQSEKLSVMLLHIRNTRLFAKSSDLSFSISAAVLAATTFFFTVFKISLQHSNIYNWNFNDVLQTRAFHLSSTLFAWSSDINITETLENEFLDASLTPIHVAMALFDGLLEFCGTLQGEAIRDLLILASLTIFLDQMEIEKRIQPQLLVHPNNTDPVEVEGSLRHFKCVNQESSTINDTLATTFKFVTIRNLLLYAYLFVQLIEYEGLKMGLIHSTLGAIKSFVLFYIGMQIHWKNSNIKKWLHLMSSYTGTVDIEKLLGMSIQSTISDFKDDPIGLGSDYFLINETFMVGFLAAVGSLISLLFQFDSYRASFRRLLH